MKPSKVLRCMFLLAILEVDLYKTWQNTKGGYVCFVQLTVETLQLCNSCIVYEHKTKKIVLVQGPSNINLNLFVCFFDVYRAF